MVWTHPEDNVALQRKYGTTPFWQFLTWRMQDVVHYWDLRQPVDEFNTLEETLEVYLIVFFFLVAYVCGCALCDHALCDYDL